MGSQAEEELLALERRPFQLPTARVVALEQSLAALWSTAGSNAPVTTCSASYSGTIQDCNNVGLVGVVVVLKDLSGGTLDTQTTTTGGAFSGSATITSPSQSVFVTATRAGSAPMSTAKTLSCGSNTLGSFGFANDNAPTLDAFSPTIEYFCGDPGAQTVGLTGIGDGDGGIQTLALSVTATSGFTKSVTYTSPNATGSLTYNPPAGFDSTGTVTVTVTDNGCNNGTTSINHFARSLSVKVVQPKTPTLNPLVGIGVAFGTVTPQTVNLSGITAGANQPAGPGNGPLTVTAVSSAPTVFSVTSVAYTSPTSSGTVTLQPGAIGTATITVTVTDTNANHCGTTTKSQTFTATVT